jgi:outer membrane protein TolC
MIGKRTLHKQSRAGAGHSRPAAAFFQPRRSPGRRSPVKRTAIPLLCAVATALLAAAAPAQDNGATRTFSLREARAYAVQHSYDVRQSRLDVESARRKLKETVASGLPQVNTSLSYLNNLELTTMLIPNFFEGKFDEKIAVQFGTQHNATFNFQVDQLLFNGSYLVGLQTSGIYRRLAEEGLERTTLDIQETVTQTYFTILITQESERILEASLKNLEKTHAEVRERHKEGFVSETDVDLIQISVTRLENSLQALRRQKQIAFRLLNFQLGLDLDEPVAVSDRLDDFLVEAGAGTSTEQDFDPEDSVDFRLLVTQEKLAELALKNEKSKFWPTISAFYTYQRSAMRDSFDFFKSDKDWFRAQILGVNINFPIFKSGAQRARVQQAALALEQASNNREQAAQGLRLEISRAETGLQSARENFQNMSSNLALAEKVYDVTLIKYNEGVASSMELTQAHDKYLAAQSEYIQSVSGLLTARNRLDRLTDNY